MIPARAYVCRPTYVHVCMHDHNVKAYELVYVTYVYNACM